MPQQTLRVPEIEFPPDFFDPPDPRPESMPENPELRWAVEWFKSFLPEGDWVRRRERIAQRLFLASMGSAPQSGDGRFFDSSDTFGWYLFQAESLLDYFDCYDYQFGSRIIPVFESIGRDRDHILQLKGIEARVRRLVLSERAQPNGGLFEILVATCYRRAGAEVAFVDEQPGRRRSHDIDATLDGTTWAIECKRMEVGDYGEKERLRIGELWRQSAQTLTSVRINTLCHIRFRVELAEVPDAYLADKVQGWLSSSQEPLMWSDDVGTGTISALNLEPLREELSGSEIASSSNRLLELLTGRYIRNARYSTVLSLKFNGNPRYVDDCDLAIVLHWESQSDGAIDSKAKDIRKKLSEAVSQLPDGRPSIVHIGFEAVEGDDVERRRYEKIWETARTFDPDGKQLEYIYCHYLVPESPPDQTWAYDETTQWCAVNRKHPIPMEQLYLVLPSAAEFREGPHWQD